MRREILRINNLNYGYTLTRRLENISLCILEGECVGFLGLTYSGKDLLVQLLFGRLDEGANKIKVYIEGQKISGKLLEEKMYHITASNYRIDDWTVAEYIGLVDTSWLRMMLRGRMLEEEVRGYFEELSLDIDVTKRIRELTELEKRIVDLVKAYRRGAKVVIIEDEFEGMDSDALKEFAKKMKCIITGRMAVIVNSHSHVIMSLLSDKYIIFNKGRIVKKCPKTYIRSDAHLERFLLGDAAISHKMSLDNYVLEQARGSDIVYPSGHTVTHAPSEPALCDIVYKVRKLALPGGRIEDFDFVKGNVVTFLVLDRKEKERIFMALSGRKMEEETYYILNAKRYNHVNFDIFAREKVVSVKHLGSREEIFTRMTVGENLILPSLGKISSMEYIASSSRIPKMVMENIEEREAYQNMAAGELGINDLISMTLGRWCIYNPRVLVLFEPFALCDINGVSIVKSYIKKFANRGTSVIIVKTREEYVEDISNRIISID